LFGSRFFPLAASQLNLKRLLIIRLIVFACQVAAVLYARFLLELDLEYTAILLVLGLVAIVNVLVVLRLKNVANFSDTEFLGHLLFDVITLSLLIYLSGGASNPFVSFFLVPITISAAILPWTFTWAVAGISLGAYTLLLFWYLPLSALLPMDAHMDMDASGGISLHILGMWFNFLVSAVLITYFVVKMATEIRAQDKSLNHYREENLRNEQILAVATQAAGTAHELGTPLNTMTILVNEMTDDYADNEALQKDIAVLNQQLDTCKLSLRELVNRANLKEGGTARPSDVETFIYQVTDQWQLLRPETNLQIHITSPDASPPIMIDATLQQAIVNILNNAADASPDRVSLEAGWNDREWFLKIRDYGDGIKEELVTLLGSRIFSDKEKGMGVGMILSQASINRMGGRILMTSHDHGGTVIEIFLPFESLERSE